MIGGPIQNVLRQSTPDAGAKLNVRSKISRCVTYRVGKRAQAAGYNLHILYGVRCLYKFVHEECCTGSQSENFLSEFCALCEEVTSIEVRLN